MKNKLLNIFPKNPTQTKYLRFLRGPRSGLQSSFSEARKKFNSFGDIIKKDRLGERQ